MSHPVPTREYGNESEPQSPKEKAIRRKMGKVSKKGRTIRTLKAMINQPASKEWFKKYN